MRHYLHGTDAFTQPLGWAGLPATVKVPRQAEAKYRSSGNSACQYRPGTRQMLPDLHIILHRLHLSHVELEDVGQWDLHQTQVGVPWAGNSLG